MEMLMHRGLSDNELKKLKINKEKYTELMKNDLEAIDVYLANQLEKIFGIQKDFWLNMQKNYEKEEKAKKWMEMKEYEQTTKIMCPKCNIYQTKHIEEERPKK